MTWRGLRAGSFVISSVISSTKAIKPAVTVGGAEKWKTWATLLAGEIYEPCASVRKPAGRQREYSKSREATRVSSSVGTGSLCLRRLAM